MSIIEKDKRDERPTDNADWHPKDSALRPSTNLEPLLAQILDKRLR